MIAMLQELDIKSRAVASIVDDWQGSTVSGAPTASVAATNGNRPASSVWKLDDVVDLIVKTVESAGKVPEACAAIDRDKAIASGEAESIVSALDGIAQSLELLSRAIATALSIVEMFESQGIGVGRADDLRQSSYKLLEIIGRVRQFSEALGWEELNRQALPADEFKQLMAYMIETGKASA